MRLSRSHTPEPRARFYFRAQFDLTGELRVKISWVEKSLLIEPQTDGEFIVLRAAVESVRSLQRTDLDYRPLSRPASEFADDHSISGGIDGKPQMIE